MFHTTLCTAFYYRVLGIFCDLFTTTFTAQIDNARKGEFGFGHGPFYYSFKNRRTLEKSEFSWQILKTEAGTKRNLKTEAGTNEISMPLPNTELVRDERPGERMG